MFKKRHPKIGARPGTLVISPDALPSRVRLIQYAPAFARDEAIIDLAHINHHMDEATVTWIDVRGLGDETVLRFLASHFSIHPLAMEDIVNVPQRPKTELYGDQQLIICRAVCTSDPQSIEDEQVSLLIGSNYVITFQEEHSGLFDSVQQRIQLADSRLRKSGTDYLAYAILDAIVDAYYPVLETVGENLERLEDVVIEHPHPALLKQLNTIRRRLSRLRRAIWPKRELVRSLIHDENPLIGEQSRMFLRDTYDHALQVSEAVDMCRESVTNMMNSYISAVGHRTNEVMKVLTIMSSIFVPLTFMAGIYGMNFEHMPELQLPWAYPLIWATMLGCAAGMLYFFRRQGWIGSRATRASIAQLLTESSAPIAPEDPGQDHLAERIVPLDAHPHGPQSMADEVHEGSRSWSDLASLRRAS